MEPTTYIGYLACTLTTVSFLPQVIKVVLEKKTRDISRNMYVVLSLGVISWLGYGILKTDLPIIIANSLTLVFTLTILFYKLKSEEE